MEYLWGFLIGFGSSLAASFSFLYFILYRMRPKIVISPHISKRPNPFDEGTPFMYVFKIVNKSFHPAFDASIELYELHHYPAEDGKEDDKLNVRYIPLRLKKSHFARIPSKKGYKKSSVYAEHCILFRSLENLELILREESKSVQLQITLRHGLTGLSRCFTKNYVGISKIKDKPFPFGDNVEIN